MEDNLLVPKSCLVIANEHIRFMVFNSTGVFLACLPTKSQNNAEWKMHLSMLQFESIGKLDARVYLHLLI